MRQAKVFFLICAGLLMLTVALKISTEPAWADYDPGAPGPFVAMSGGRVVLGSGDCWVAWNDMGQPEWTRTPALDPPIQVSEIFFYDGEAILSTSGDLWVYFYTDWPNGEWTNMGVPPGAPTAGTSWSQLKARFGR